MNIPLVVTLGVLIPLVGTTLGAATVFVLPNGMGARTERFLFGFASGVMIAASVWSLLIPAIEMAEQTSAPAWVPATVGFLLGVLFLLLLDHLIPHLHIGASTPEGRPGSLGGRTMLFLAVTLHNLPEGMAVGVVLAGLLRGNPSITVSGALALCVGIAVQNIPEGAVISAPLRGSGSTRTRSFLSGLLSGVVEPLGACLVILATSLLTPILPYILAFAAGAMIYVVVEELIPDARGNIDGDVGTVGAALGFAVMMILDVALGSQ